MPCPTRPFFPRRLRPRPGRTPRRPCLPHRPARRRLPLRPQPDRRAQRAHRQSRRPDFLRKPFLSVQCGTRRASPGLWPRVNPRPLGRGRNPQSLAARCLLGRRSLPHPQPRRPRRSGAAAPRLALPPAASLPRPPPGHRQGTALRQARRLPSHPPLKMSAKQKALVS